MFRQLFFISSQYSQWSIESDLSTWSSISICIDVTWSLYVNSKAADIWTLLCVPGIDEVNFFQGDVNSYPLTTLAMTRSATLTV